MFGATPYKWALSYSLPLTPMTASSKLENVDIIKTSGRFFVCSFLFFVLFSFEVFFVLFRFVSFRFVLLCFALLCFVSFCFVLFWFGLVIIIIKLYLSLKIL